MMGRNWIAAAMIVALCLLASAAQAIEPPRVKPSVIEIHGERRAVADRVDQPALFAANARIGSKGTAERNGRGRSGGGLLKTVVRCPAGWKPPSYESASP